EGQREGWRSESRGQDTAGVQYRESYTDHDQKGSALQGTAEHGGRRRPNQWRTLAPEIYRRIFVGKFVGAVQWRRTGSKRRPTRTVQEQGIAAARCTGNVPRILKADLQSANSSAEGVL